MSASSCELGANETKETAMNVDKPPVSSKYGPDKRRIYSIENLLALGKASSIHLANLKFSNDVLLGKECVPRLPR